MCQIDRSDDFLTIKKWEKGGPGRGFDRLTDLTIHFRFRLTKKGRGVSAGRYSNRRGKTIAAPVRMVRAVFH